MIAEAQLFADISGHDVEILVVDNGSTDRSSLIASQAGAQVIREDVKGYGAAIRAGLERARGDSIVIADADGQHPLLECSALLSKLDSGADLVVGIRRDKPGQASSPWLNRSVGTPALSMLARLITGAPVKDYHCGFRAIRRDASNRLLFRCDGMEFASEMIVRVHQAGMRIAQCEIYVRPSERPRSAHLRPFRDGWRHLRTLVRCSLFKPEFRDAEPSPEKTSTLEAALPEHADVSS